jgi:hypothetical protein
MAIHPKSQAQLLADFSGLPGQVKNQNAVLIGGHACLHRYAAAAEKTDVNLGTYNPSVAQTYPWPNRCDPNSLIDLPYTQLFIDAAGLNFFTHNTGVNGVVAPVANNNHAVRHSIVAFKANGTAYPRNAALLRDVQVGDIAIVNGNVGGTLYSLTTYVDDFIGDTVPGAVAAATSDPANNATQTASTSIVRTAGPGNCIELIVDGSLYNGLAAGFITETYTVTVIQGSVGGNLATALLSVTSASGTDNVASIAPAGLNVFTNIGTRGLRLEFIVNNTVSCTNLATSEGIPADDLVAGMTWSIKVKQAFTAPVSTSGGSYAGTTNTGYIVTVSKGGLWAANPQIKVSTTTGVDLSGPTIVTGATTFVPIGTQGVTIEFSANGLCTGDRYHVSVTAATQGSVQTLVLASQLPSQLLTATDLNLQLFIQDNIQVPQNRTSSPPNKNWTTAQSGITVNPGIIAYDPSWVDVNGVEQPLPVLYGTVYVQYREWDTTWVGRIGFVTLPVLVQATLGAVSPDNPLAQAAFVATQNSNGQPVYFTALADPTNYALWTTATQLFIGLDGSTAYNVVPLSQDPAVLTIIQDMVIAESQRPGLWKATFFSPLAVTTKVLVSAANSKDNNPVLATLVADPNAPTTQYTKLVASGTNNPGFVTSGVQPGDQVRFLFTTDGFGNTVYTTFTVASVLREDSLLFTAGNPVPISTAQKFEIWHPSSQGDIAAAETSFAAQISSARVCIVWPDQVGSGGVTMGGQFLCAALAGQRSGTCPHQGLAETQLLGFDNLNRSTVFLRQIDLDTMANNGVWVVSQNQDGTVFTYSANTSDTSLLQNSLEEVRADTDACNIFVLNNLSVFKGKANVIDNVLTAMRVQAQSAMEFLKGNTLVTNLGNMLIDGQILQMRASTITANTVIATMAYTIPLPVGQIVVSIEI